MIMRSLVKFWGLIFNRLNRTAQKGNACRPSHMKACRCDDFAAEPERRFPDKGWRLLTSIIYASQTDKLEDRYDLELDEDVLERIDFFACLFGSRKIE